jgi:putative ABC transport system permease protein
VVTALDRKLVRDLWHMRSQVVTVALVVASAFAGFAGSLGTYESLARARDAFYETARFGDVFANLKRAPRPVERALAAIPGVAEVATTVVFDATLDIASVATPVTGRLVGLPPASAPGLDRLVVRRGRAPAALQDEVVVSEGFADARRIAIGSRIEALVNGRVRTLSVVGIGIAPDYIYATAGGAFPDDRNFGVLWTDRERLAALCSMEGAFNHVAIRLAPDASERAVVAAVDRLLAPYGGMAAHGRDEQLSHRILAQEISQWRVIGTMLPSIFLAVSAFLLNVVLSRQVSIQREQIAALKAIGYRNGELLAHYLAQVAVIVGIGIAAGIGFGIWFGRAVTALYAEFFRFPAYSFALPSWVVLVATAVTLGAAVAGTFLAVRRAVSIAPAEAMRPPSPGHFGPTLLDRIGWGSVWSPSMRITIRNMERRPLRSLATTAGIAGAMAVIISGMFWSDALDYMIDVEFEHAQRGDAHITLVEPADAGVLREVRRMPGVLVAEGSLDLGVRLTAGHRSYRTAIQGIDPHGSLRRALDVDLEVVPIPDHGLLLTDRLAQRLAVGVGDTVHVEMQTGKRLQRDVTVVGITGDLMDLSAYMEREALVRLAGEPDSVSSIAVRLDRGADDALFSRLKAYPRVATVASKSAMLANFRETSARNVLFFTTILTAFASLIAIGVVYNNARIALQERTWELASLRVLGFTRGEVSTFLLGELAIELVAALPLGGLLGYLLSLAIVSMSHSDMIAVPVVIAPRTHLYAALAIIAAGIASALVVRRRIDRLDMVGALKTRE